MFFPFISVFKLLSDDGNYGDGVVSVLDNSNCHRAVVECHPHPPTVVKHSDKDSAEDHVTTLSNGSSSNALELLIGQYNSDSELEPGEVP